MSRIPFLDIKVVIAAFIRLISALLFFLLNVVWLVAQMFIFWKLKEFIYIYIYIFKQTETMPNKYISGVDTLLLFHKKTKNLKEFNKLSKSHLRYYFC